MLMFDKVSFSYGKKKVLESFSLRAEAGECVALWGRNGVGKSTVLALAAGVLKQTNGRVVTEGGIGYVPQGTALPEDMTVSECLRFFARLRRSPLPSSLPFSVEEVMGKRISALSGGMKKRVSITCALLGDPSLMLLDEPCASLDLVFRDEMIRTVTEWKGQGKTILYVGHDPAEFYGFFDTLVILGEETTILPRASLASETADPLRFEAFLKEALA